MELRKPCCIYEPLYIFKGKEFHINGKLSIKVYQKPENKYMYIPLYTLTLDIPLKNYILGELKRYVRINTDELNFLKIKHKKFSLVCVIAGSII